MKLRAKWATLRSIAYSVALALVCVLVLGTRVPLVFERIRFRVVTTPRLAETPALTVALPDLSRLAGSPASIIVRLHGAAEPINISVILDDRLVSHVTAPASREMRVDVSAYVPPGIGHQILLKGDRAGWQLKYLEIANVYGFSSGIASFTIAPREQRQFAAVPPWIVLPTLITLLSLGPRLDWPARRAARWFYRTGVCVILLLFGTTLTIDRFTQYKLLVSIESYVLCVGILYAERTSQVCRDMGTILLLFGRAMNRRAMNPVATLTSRAATTVAAWPRGPTTLAGAAAITVAVMALAYGSHAAGGADAYGYISQSELWMRGKVHVSQPIVNELPADITDWAVTPLGYVPHFSAGIRGQLVPTYSPGLPLVMAAFRLAGGPDAVYLVVPALAAMTVWLTFLLGSRLQGAATGVVGALLLASSPAFIAAMLNPMSDVPVTAWWLLAFVASFSAHRRSATISGVATSVAILTRPNIVPIAALIASVFMWRIVVERENRRSRVMEFGIFIGSAAVGPIIVAILFNYWYGSPLASGYGPLDYLYAWSYVLPNLSRYTRWLIESETVLIAAGLAAPLLLRKSASARAGTSAATLSWLMLAFCALVWACYLPYFPFETWEYLRFLLPGYPFMCVLASAVLVALLRRTVAPVPLGAILVLLLVVHGLQFASRNTTLNLAKGESRYRRVGEFARRALPDRAALISMQHSGSLRYYSSRLTIRYDSLPRDRLDHVVGELDAHGFQPYFVLDAWEEEVFRTRFGARNRLGSLDWPPIALTSGSMYVAVYDPRDRKEGKPALTRIIP